MTIIRPNSIAGVTSITAQSGSLNFYTSGGGDLPVVAGSVDATNFNITGVGTITSLDSTNVVITGVTTVSAGSTSAPSITPSGDSNTGVFFPSADTIAFAEGGVEAARIDSSGNLSIANGNLVFSTSGTGIDFSATGEGSGTMTSELLDDYEEGTWTPVLTSTNADTVVGAYNSLFASYCKIGKIVHIQMYMTTNVTSAGTGNVIVTGLPFVSGSTYSAFSLSSVGRWSTQGPRAAEVIPTSTTITLYETDVALGSTLATPLSTARLITGQNFRNVMMVAGCYITS